MWQGRGSKFLTTCFPTTKGRSKIASASLDSRVILTSPRSSPHPLLGTQVSQTHEISLIHLRSTTLPSSSSSTSSRSTSLPLVRRRRRILLLDLLRLLASSHHSPHLTIDDLEVLGEGRSGRRSGVSSWDGNGRRESGESS